MLNGFHFIIPPTFYCYLRKISVGRCRGLLLLSNYQDRETEWSFRIKFLVWKAWPFSNSAQCQKYESRNSIYTFVTCGFIASALPPHIFNFPDFLGKIPNLPRNFEHISKDFLIYQILLEFFCKYSGIRQLGRNS